MRLLDAVNLVMPKLNERPVTTLQQKHPTLAILLPIIDNVRRQLLNKKWWFNVYDYVAYPDPANKIYLGTNVLAFYSEKPNVVVRGDKLYDISARTYDFTEKIEGVVVEDVDFDDLPESAAQVVLHAALVELYATDIGMSKDLALWAQAEDRARKDLLAEHLRHKRHNTRNSPAWRRMNGARFS